MVVGCEELPPKMMRISRRVLFSFGSSGLLAGCAARTAPIRQGGGDFIGTAPLHARADQIRAAGARRGWAMTERQPGWVRGLLNLRSHQAVVDIRFDARHFTINYVSSVALNYDGQSIHQNYNSWVQYLEADIIREPALQT